MMKEIVLMIVSLILVIGLIYATYWFCRRLPGQPKSMALSNRIRVVARTMIGREQSIVVVEVEGQQYLLGCTTQQVNLLDKLEHPLTDLQSHTDGFSGNDKFADWLTEKMKDNPFRKDSES